MGNGPTKNDLQREPDVSPLADTDPPPACWGCELGVPVVAGRHEEPTDINGTVYTYPCGAVPA
jgi:hypothetical protein